jgi:hypothetical protein
MFSLGAIGAADVQVLLSISQVEGTRGEFECPRLTSHVQDRVSFLGLSPDCFDCLERG